MSSLHLYVFRPPGRIPVSVAGRDRPTSLNWVILDAGRTNAAGISRFGGEVSRHSGDYEFHSCPFCRVVSRRELFAKIFNVAPMFSD